MTSVNSFEKFIDECGLNKYYSGKSNLNVRLYHDLNIYGDIAESYIEILRDNHNVDVSQFNFHDYFPPEFSGNSQLKKIMFSLIPFLRAKFEDKKEYLPFTFHMINEAINIGRLR
jgi:hypothetical protein